LTEEQYKLIEQLHGFAVTLGQSLNDLQNQLSAGRIKWGELANKGTPLFQKTSQNMQLQQFENIDKTFQDYPTLIYDGPFSDHMTMTEPKGLTGNEMNPEEAKQRVVDFFGKDKVSAVEDIGRNDATTIKTYSYRVKFNMYLRNRPQPWM